MSATAEPTTPPALPPASAKLSGITWKSLKTEVGAGARAYMNTIIVRPILRALGNYATDRLIGCGCAVDTVKTALEARGITVGDADQDALVALVADAVIASTTELAESYGRNSSAVATAKIRYGGVCAAPIFAQSTGNKTMPRMVIVLNILDRKIPTVIRATTSWRLGEYDRRRGGYLVANRHVDIEFVRAPAVSEFERGVREAQQKVRDSLAALGRLAELPELPSTNDISTAIFGAQDLVSKLYRAVQMARAVSEQPGDDSTDANEGGGGGIPVEPCEGSSDDRE